MLTDAISSDKARSRSDAVSALSIVGPDRRAVRTVENELDDKDEGIRALAATSLGDMRARSAIPKLRKAMNDPSPRVSFAAAQALWTLGDHSGRDLLYDVLIGERKATEGVVKSHVDKVKKDLHDPKTLALIGINEASGAFLGPFAMGISFAEEYAKDSSAPVQARCANLLASDNTSDTAEQLASALDDKNWIVRAAAAKALAEMNRRQMVPKLKDMMETDKDEPARLVAAAAILKLSEERRETIPSRRAAGKAAGGKVPE
jgi:HEAT repeat protein